MFAREYIVDLNATQAYFRVYKSCKKQSTAEVRGSKLLSNVKVSTRIRELMNARAEKVELKADNVLKDLMSLLDVEMGRIPTKKVITEGMGEGVTNVSERDMHETDTKGANATLTLMMRHLGMLNDKVKIEGNYSLKDALIELEK